ncbi:MAG: ornithine cyclodeaminase family protein [Candidatus Aminicenantes bacterium]|nr:ornithine cyclodeaminase family protein [Candidatus Aminicenantes bacterium]
MPRIVGLDQIRKILPSVDLLPAIEAGFAAYSEGRAVVPPVAELLFNDPPGDVHIKYGYLKGDAHYVIKIASGFYENPKRGLSSSDGLMLLFCQKTGRLLCLLLDEGHLTNVRTAAAGAVAAKYLAPQKANRIGIIGAGIQGKLQLLYLKSVVSCRKALVWGLHQAELEAYQEEMKTSGFDIQTTLETGEIAAACDLIVTATPSKTPLLQAGQIRKGTHITAVGSDTPEKQELDPFILQKADLIVADSLSQCLTRGEIFRAIQEKAIPKEKAVELGAVVTGKVKGRTSDDQITVADLTGVAVQDIQIAKIVYDALRD